MYKYILGIVALVGSLLIILGRELTLPSANARAPAVHSVPVQKKIVALTFDDGPHPVYTRQLLDILHKYHVKATFFMVGSAMKKYPETVNAVLAKGHALGNHTYSHPGNLAACSNRKVVREITDCQAVIKSFTGRTAVIFRPPRGLYDERVLKIVRQKGLRTILWTVCGNQKQATTPQLIARRVTTHIRPGGIILLHDGIFDSRWKDVEATQIIIEDLLKKGYQFATIPQLLKMERQKTN